jgi:tetratricopeptide (TPR) repeat protein
MTEYRTAQEWHAVGRQMLIGGHNQAARVALVRAIAGGCDGSLPHKDLAVANWRLGDLKASRAEWEAAIVCDPNDADALHKLALLHGEQGDLDASIALLERVVAMRLDLPAAAWNLTLHYLSRGDWAKGWEMYDSRFDYLPMHYPKMPMPLWRGELLEGKTIWVLAEQGVGDTIQFSRYVPWLIGQGAKVIFDCPPELGDLLYGFSGIEGVTLRAIGAQGRFTQAWLPQADYFLPLMSLAHRHGTTLDNVPPDAGLISKVAAAYRVNFDAGQVPGLHHVGLVWAGSAGHAGDALRTMSFKDVLPLTSRGDCAFHSLQVGPRAADIGANGAGDLVADVGNALSNWVLTAATINALDVLITVDTGVAHLAGALGKPVWMLVSTEPDFRWTRAGESTPWYPTMKLFRQKKKGDWTSVVNDVAASLDVAGRLDDLCREKMRTACVVSR